MTDIHLDFPDDAARAAFVGALAACEADALIVSGDIATAEDVDRQLVALADAVRRPVYFVLGNHDFYGGSIRAVRQRLGETCPRHPHLRWMNTVDHVALTPQTALVGHDGWADGRNGDYAGSHVMLRDDLVIDELAMRSPAARLVRLHALGDEAAAHFERVLPDALTGHPNVVALTHAPPFREASWHEGTISTDDFLPHFSQRAAGEVLARHAAAHPGRSILVLCGHTHGSGEVSILPNLRVLTGGAVYGKPIFRLLDVA